MPRDLTESERDVAEKLNEVVRWMHAAGSLKDARAIGLRVVALSFVLNPDPMPQDLARRLRFSTAELAAAITEARKLLLRNALPKR